MAGKFGLILDNYRETEWICYKKRKYRKLKNQDVSIISSNCSGAFMYYVLGMRYLSPSVVLSIEMYDFV